jgi:hypothetical protein
VERQSFDTSRRFGIDANPKGSVAKRRLAIQG